MMRTPKWILQLFCLLLTLAVFLPTAVLAEGWTCTSCGKTELNQAFMFCPYCAAPQPNESKCSKCGFVFDDSMTGFICCPLCGTARTDAEPEPAALVNMARGTIDGEPYTFYLRTTDSVNSGLRIFYYAKNPRGEYEYQLRIIIPHNARPGKSLSGVSISLFGDPRASSRHMDGTNWYTCWDVLSTDKNPQLEFELTYRDETWTTYSGKFSAVLTSSHTKPAQRKIEMEFNFTLGDCHPNALPTEAAQPLGVATASQTANTCIYCNGLRSCSVCQGLKTIDCSTCGGTGDCTVCYGEPEQLVLSGGTLKRVYCSACNRSGDCPTCKGQREFPCTACNSSGNCPYC